MVIYLYGPDSYRRQKKLNKIVEEYRNKYSNLSCDFFDFDPLTGSGQDELLRLKEFARQQLIFDNKKLAILKNTLKSPENLKEFLKTYLTVEDLTILISEEGAAPAEFKSLLKKAFAVEKFDYLQGDEWLSFIQKEAAQRKISLTSPAVYFLARIFKDDTWGLINELDKAALLCEKQPLEPSNFKKIGDFGHESPDIFDFINRVIRNWSLPEKVIALEKLFLAQEEPLKIFNIMASLKRLPKNLLQKLADYDVMAKSGKIDYEEILLELALQ